MSVYFAPMEGITGRLFRSSFEEVFPHTIDKYFSPFIASGVTKGVAGKDLKELSPDQNKGFVLVPQLLTNDSRDFANTAKTLQGMGYDEINLNLGCPSKTVVSKKRGSGMLEDPERLEAFLEEAFSFSDQNGIRLSLKTRLGSASDEEFVRLLSIYDCYPVHELIIHLRVRTDYYKLPLRPGWFDFAAKNSKLKLVYNGDIQSRREMEQIQKTYPAADVMIGRGFLMRPWMLEESASGEPGEILGRENPGAFRKFWQFHDRLYQRYKEEMPGERAVLFKCKELWFYMAQSFDTASEDRGRENKKAMKAIKKSQYLSDYEGAIEILRHPG
ncbi:MAG: tRNA-dihydrouridine synthase family protein [Lachnospiraceae bacterium]|nr:tRNA-dihydrouridine synthase family protein [Lachnospiraceae bacterium]